MPAGVYIHIPFCKSRCSYCDFATDVYRSDEAVERYVAALLKETGIRTRSGSDGQDQNLEFGSQSFQDKNERAPKGRQDISPGQAEGPARGTGGNTYQSRVAATDIDEGKNGQNTGSEFGVTRDEDSLRSLQASRLRSSQDSSSPITHHSSLSPQHSALLASRLRFDSIYFGGGTPSLLNPGQLGRILEAVRDRFDVSEDAEVTIEMNPATVTLDQLKEYRALGVNRASFGVQTFDDRSLKLLARGHDAEDARKTYDLLRNAGFDNVSFDLIAGLPHQTLGDWKKNLDEALGMSPEHISLYLLEIHEATPLAEQVRSGRQPMPDEELAAEMYEVMLEKLGAAGYSQYEISNFSREGFESRHNLKYWELDPVIGFGVSAHSFDGTSTRWVNIRDTNGYVHTLELGDSPVVEIEKLDEARLKAEYAFLKLRLNKGLDLDEYEQRFGSKITEEFASELEEFSGFGLVELTSDGRLALTDKGRLYSNEVFGVFV